MGRTVRRGRGTHVGFSFYGKTLYDKNSGICRVTTSTCLNDTDKIKLNILYAKGVKAQYITGSLKGIMPL